MPYPLLVRASELSQLSGLSARKLRHVSALGGGKLWPTSRKWYLRPVAEHVLQQTPLINPLGEVPAVPLLRRADVLAWLGLTDDQLDHMLSHTDETRICFRASEASRRLYRTTAITDLLQPLCPEQFRTEARSA